MWNPLQKKSARDELMALLKESVPRGKSTASIAAQTDLRELGIDSLGLVMLVVKFCETYGFDPASLAGNVEAVRTVGGLLELGERVLAARAPAPAALAGEHP